MTISHFFVLSQRGDSIIAREFRGDLGARVDVKASAEIFFRKVKSSKGDTPPIFNVDGAQYCFIKRHGLFFVCTTVHNVSPSYLIELLNQIVKVCKDHCGLLNEETMRRNYVLIYELLDEMLDCGYAQATNTEVLKSFVFSEPIAPSSGLASVIKNFKLPDFNPKTTPSTSVFKPITATADRSGTRGRNEVFVDIIERISATFNSSGMMSAGEIQGCIQMKSYLIGNPELRLALNPDLVVGRSSGPGYGVVLDDCNFHECVRLDGFERDKELLLVPPEGEFVAMNYRVTSAFTTPIRLYPTLIELSPFKLELELRLKAEMTDSNYVCNLTVTFPVPKSSTNVSFEVGEGATGQKTEYKPKTQTCTWKLKRLQGANQVILKVKIVQQTAATAMTKKEVGPYGLEFEIPMYNVSGLNVKFLEIISQNSKQKAFRWVRYVTHSNSYVVRGSS